MVKTRIAVFVSGGGTNLQALLDAEKSGALISGEIVLVISSARDAYALERARLAGVDGVAVVKKECGSQEAFEAAIAKYLRDYDIELIVLAGFLNILSENFTKKWRERIINIHPSLIPAFCGKGMYGLKVHEAALAKGVKVTGATVHYVNEIPDGGEILLQKAVEVKTGDTPEILQRRVMEEAEWILLPQAAEMISARIAKKRSRTMNVYEVKDLAEVLGNNPYPGRGIILGTTPDGTSSVAAYFIMGRSINSRNRVFVEEPDGIRTEAFDPSLMQDPSLIIYHPIREADKKLIVTNGNQTDTIHDFLLAGRSFNAALRTRDFEPDAPNYTPRISGLVDEDGNYCLNILKSVDPNGTGCVRETFEYPAVAGLGHFLHTYETNGDPIPSFTGEPERVAILNDIQEFTDLIWNNLDEDNKISLFVRYTNLRDGWRDQRIINKNK